jgi:hypothetical protein
MPRLAALALLLLSDLALAAPGRQYSSGGSCCSLFFIILFTAIYRSGGADWGRAIGTAIIPGVFGWFIWRDRELGTGSRWCALVCASLQAFAFVAGVVLGLLVSAGVFNSFLGLHGPGKDDAAKVSSTSDIDLSKIPEDEALGLHPPATITSDPPGAKVFVNGKERGKTPLETKLTAGERNEVNVELTGYFPASQSRAPNAREHLTFSFTLMAAARLKLDSTPPGARVLVNKKEMLPHTPGFSGPIEPGEAEVLVLLDGYQAHREKVTLPLGDTELQATLEPGVKIAVTSVPDQGEVFLDGAWVGVTPTSVFVAPKGKHTLEVKKETYADARKLFASVSKPVSWEAKLVDTGRVRAQQAVARARANYDKVNHDLEKVQAKLEAMYNPSPKLERQREALDFEMEKAAGALEKAEAALKAIEEERNGGRPPAPPPEPDP